MSNEMERRHTPLRPGGAGGNNGNGQGTDTDFLRDMRARNEEAFRNVGQRARDFTKKRATTAERAMRTTRNRSGQ